MRSHFMVALNLGIQTSDPAAMLDKVRLVHAFLANTVVPRFSTAVITETPLRLIQAALPANHYSPMAVTKAMTAD